MPWFPFLMRAHLLLAFCTFLLITTPGFLFYTNANLTSKINMISSRNSALFCQGLGHLFSLYPSAHKIPTKHLIQTFQDIALWAGYRPPSPPPITPFFLPSLYFHSLQESILVDSIFQTKSFCSLNKTPSITTAPITRGHVQVPQCKNNNKCAFFPTGCSDYPPILPTIIFSLYLCPVP